MFALLDVNVLIALFDQDHVFHNRSHDWLEAQAAEGIATCPITENGLIRILSHPGYSRQFKLPPSDVIRRLENFVKAHKHQFWADEISLRNAMVFKQARIIGSKQLTDIYLLALAVKNNGRLVTFDQHISTDIVNGTKPEHIEVIL